MREQTFFSMTFQNARILTCGIYLGLIISSRFLLDFQEGFFYVLLSFVLLYAEPVLIFSTIKSVQQNESSSEWSVGKVIRFTMKVMIVGAIISSVVKFAYFEYARPAFFARTIQESIDLLTSQVNYPQESIDLAMRYMTSGTFAIVSGISNLFWSIPLGAFIAYVMKQEKYIVYK